MPVKEIGLRFTYRGSQRRPPCSAAASLRASPPSLRGCVARGGVGQLGQRVCAQEWRARARSSRRSVGHPCPAGGCPPTFSACAPLSVTAATTHPGERLRLLVATPGGARETYKTEMHSNRNTESSDPRGRMGGGDRRLSCRRRRRGDGGHSSPLQQTRTWPCLALPCLVEAS